MTAEANVNESLCQGHGQCELVSPDLFELNDLGFAMVKVGRLTTDDEVTAARLAARACPERAITVRE